MRKRVKFRRPSTACTQLARGTVDGSIHWVGHNALQEYLEIEGLSVSWLQEHEEFLQAICFHPRMGRTYYVFFWERIFAISQSKHTGMIRLDFTSDIPAGESWWEVITSQEQLRDLISLVDAADYEDSDAYCKDLLYATGHILA